MTETQFLPTQYQQFIAKSRYARWLEEANRRETWEETVGRYVNYMVETMKTYNDYVVPDKIRNELHNAILSTNDLPSMRAVMTAGPALERDNVAGYNCSYLPIDNIRSFDEAMYILLCGTGVGFSVESRYVNQLPVINEHFEESLTTISVGDSKAGWARGLRELLALLWQGQVPSWDTSNVRKAGAKLKTFGGRASGPEPLEELFHFAVQLITNAAGRKLTSLEAHDLVCKIAEVVVVGGVRRSALISLSDLNDSQMAHAKSGEWWRNNPQRALANNSAVYESNPGMEVFFSEWKSLYDSKSGERGIFNRQAARAQAAKNGRRDADQDFGTNPCSEIILRPYQFCNLSEVVVKSTDTLDDLKAKVRLATILGTMQSSLTRFKYLRKIWKKNCEEERLLGVSLTGQFGHSVLSGQEGDDKLAEWLDILREVAVETNAEFADAIGVAHSTAITCVKPSGTVSQLANASSGMHPWHSDFYIRTVRGDNKDPMTQFLIDSGVPNEPDVMKPRDTTVFSFPIKAPDGALTRADLTAIRHLEIWKIYQEHWCEHKPSITISVQENEWLGVGNWVYENFDALSGVSFLPHSEHTYKQAPYQEVSEVEYKELAAQMPQINWDLLPLYEFEDGTTGSQELACVAGACEVVDIK